MNLLLHLDPDIESRLLERAKHEGKAPEAIAIEALDEKLTPDGARSVAARLAAFRVIVDAKPDGNPNADVSRGSVYE
jgi:hypothetical protein